MPEHQTTARPDEAATTATPAKGALEKRRRIGEITAIARQFDVPAADVSAAIEDGTSIDQFRRLPMELIQLRSRSSGPSFAGATWIAIQQERAEPYSWSAPSRRRCPATGPRPASSARSARSCAGSGGARPRGSTSRPRFWRSATSSPPPMPAP